jgi:hypothetical protein
MLQVNHTSSVQTIDFLSKLPTETKLMIKNFKCSLNYKECTNGFHLTFIQESSQILFTITRTSEKILRSKIAIDHAARHATTPKLLVLTMVFLLSISFDMLLGFYGIDFGIGIGLLRH